MRIEKESSKSERERWSGLYYHHARPLIHCSYSTVQQEFDGDDYFEGAYKWLEQELGFYPLFLAVGSTEDDIRMTGYQNQWRRLLAGTDKDTKNQQSRNVENMVLFSYKDLPSPNAVFTDYQYWHIVLNSQHNGYQVTKREKSWIFKSSWSKSDWLRQAKRNPHSVQLVVPSLNITIADQISVRNKVTKRHLEEIGFGNVEVRKLTLGNS